MARGGEAIDNPVDWYNSLSRETIEFWKSHWRVEPWGMEWDRHAVMMAKLDHLLALSLNRGLHKGHKDWHSRYIPDAPVEFMPGDYFRPKASKPKANIYEQLQDYAGAILKHGNHNK